MALSEVKICNLALSLFGNLRIAALTESNEPSRLCALYYPQTRDEILGLPTVEWRFAFVRADLGAKESEAPPFQWANQFQLPSDPPVLRVINQVSEAGIAEIPWSREEDKILTNESTCLIFYIQKLTDVPKFPPLFVEALYTKLASKLARKLAEDQQAAARLLQEYVQVALPAAIGANEAEYFVPEERGAEKWTDKGRGNVDTI